MTTETDEFDIPRIIRRASTASLATYENHGAAFVDKFLENTEGPNLHLCANIKGMITIMCIFSEASGAEHKLTQTHLPLKIFRGDICFKDLFGDRYEVKQMPGMSIGPAGFSFGERMGFY